MAKHFLEGFVLGALAGLAAGVLFAPEAGQQTRQKLMDATENLTDNLKESGDHLIHGSKDKSEVMIGKTLEAIEQGFDKVSSMVDASKKNG